MCGKYFTFILMWIYNLNISIKSFLHIKEDTHVEKHLIIGLPVINKFYLSNVKL